MDRLWQVRKYDEKWYSCIEYISNELVGSLNAAIWLRCSTWFHCPNDLPFPPHI